MRFKEFVLEKKEPALELMPFDKSKSHEDPGAVQDLQRALMRLNYNVGPTKDDGIYGPNTEAAVRKFQHDNKLTIDGQPGENTISALADKLAALKISASVAAPEKPKVSPEKPKVSPEKPKVKPEKPKIGKQINLPPLPETSTIPGKIGMLLDFISRYESKGYYDMMNGMKRVPEILKMPLEQLYKFQLEWTKQPRITSAAGRYQIMHFNIVKYSKAAGLNLKTDTFNPENQDRMAVEFLKEVGLNRWMSGVMPDEVFLDRLAGIWAAIPKSSGLSAYHGDIAGNKAGVSTETALQVLKDIKKSA